MMQQHQLNAMQQQQQQQLQQQQSGQQQPDSSQQPHPGMPGFSDQRIWSQMQHMQQMRNQNGQDMNTSSQQQASNFFNLFCASRFCCLCIRSRWILPFCFLCVFSC